MATIAGVQIYIPAGSLTANELSENLDLSPNQLAQRTFMQSPVMFTNCRVWDAMQTMVLGTPANDDLALVTGTPGTNAPKLSAGDLKAAGAVSRRVAFELEVPANYDDGQTFQVRIRAAMETTIADVSCTVDLSAYRPAGDGTVGTDLVSTAAQSINSLTPTDRDFTIDASAIDPGDKLICVVTIACNDAARATPVTPVIYSIARRCHTRG